jgi:hypothetical protein
MTTRRQFIEDAFAAGIAAVPIHAAATAPSWKTHGTSHLQLERIVFDEGFADACDFSEEARRRSSRTSAINGSIHDLWYHDLFYRWRDSQSPIAGMTDHRSLFLLEMMAADAGMRVVHRVHHHESNGIYSHRIFGPLERRDEIMIWLSKARADWARCAADIVTTWPSSPTAIDSKRSDILSARLQALDARTLISWIIC